MSIPQTSSAEILALVDQGHRSIIGNIAQSYLETVMPIVLDALSDQLITNMVRLIKMPDSHSLTRKQMLAHILHGLDNTPLEIRQRILTAIIDAK